MKAQLARARRLRFVFPSEPTRERQPHRERLGGVHMAVGDTVDRLAPQTWQGGVFNLVGLRVEEIEHIELHPQAVVEATASAGVENERGERANAVVLDERPRAEIACGQGAEPAGFVAEDNGASHPRRCARYAVAHEIEIGETR